MKKTFPIEIEEDLHKRLKISAIEEGLTLQDWIIKALAERIDSNRTNANQRQKGKRNTAGTLSR